MGRTGQRGRSYQASSSWNPNPTYNKLSTTCSDSTDDPPPPTCVMRDVIYDWLLKIKLLTKEDSFKSGILEQTMMITIRIDKLGSTYWNQKFFSNLTYWKKKFFQIRHTEIKSYFYIDNRHTEIKSFFQIWHTEKKSFFKFDILKSKVFIYISTSPGCFDIDERLYSGDPNSKLVRYSMLPESC